MASCKVNLQSQIVLGHVLCLAGKTSDDCNSYKVSLSSEDERESALTIFINVRLKEIIMNSFLNSQWREESVKLGVPSMKSGERFKFYILFSDDKLHIALNDKHLCKYPLDMSSVDIKSVKVSGEIENITQIDHRQVFPSTWPPIVDDLKTTAFSSEVPSQFLPGSVIVIKMQVSGAQNGSFFIRFNERGTKRQLFHLNPRFAEKIVVVNCQNDSMQ